jgi:hypothetical protein
LPALGSINAFAIPMLPVAGPAFGRHSPYFIITLKY